MGRQVVHAGRHHPTVLAGKFGDQFGRKLLFQGSAALFVVSSALCGFAGSMTWLICWRAVQGFAAGILMVTATAVIADIIPLRERGKYQGRPLSPPRRV